MLIVTYDTNGPPESPWNIKLNFSSAKIINKISWMGKDQNNVYKTSAYSENLKQFNVNFSFFFKGIEQITPKVWSWPFPNLALIDNITWQESDPPISSLSFLMVSLKVQPLLSLLPLKLFTLTNQIVNWEKMSLIFFFHPSLLSSLFSSFCSPSKDNLSNLGFSVMLMQVFSMQPLLERTKVNIVLLFLCPCRVLSKQPLLESIESPDLLPV